MRRQREYWIFLLRLRIITMKETVNVNIGSVAFILDEDAYRVLGSYFDDIRRRCV